MAGRRQQRHDIERGRRRQKMYGMKRDGKIQERLDIERGTRR